MKVSKVIAVAVGVMMTASVAQAAHIWEDPSGWWSGVWSYEKTTAPKFTAQELSLDLFGAYGAGQRGIEHIFETDIRHGKWGGGVGLNYFITRELGISGDVDMFSEGNLVHQMVGNVVLRLPTEVGFAPYIFGGGGRSTEPTWEWLGDLGVGLEYRMNPATGIFVDGRYEWLDKSADRILFRAGLRLVF